MTANNCDFSPAASVYQSLKMGNRFVPHFVVAGALTLVLIAFGGCTTAVPLLSGAAGSVPVVGQHLGQGEVDSYWVARYDDVVQATLRAVEKLSLELTQKEIGDDRAELYLSDDRGKEIVLLIERRTDTVTRVHFDAGSQAFAGFARLLAKQIIQELKDAGAFQVSWSGDEEEDEKEDEE